MDRPGDRRQGRLAFEEAEATAAERRNLLGLALSRLQADLHLRELVLWVHNVTHGGTEGELVKSYRELAATPWGLCSSVGKARSTVARARAAGLLAVATRYTRDGQRANAYQIDWAGVSKILRIPQAADALTAHPPALTAHPPALTAHPYKEQLPSLPSSNNPEPDPEAAAGPRWEGNRDLQGIANVPEIRDAVGLIVEPLAPGKLVYGAFVPLEGRSLKTPLTMIRWHRCQLGTDCPPVGPTVAHLLLVLAAAEYAGAIPVAAVQKNRVAIFASIVGRAAWRRVLPHLPAARQSLDRLAAKHESLLTGPWPVAVKQST